MKVRCLLAVVGLLIFPKLAISAPAASNAMLSGEPKQVSICDIRMHPGHYRNNLLLIHARLVSAVPHGELFAQSGCRYRIWRGADLNPDNPDIQRLDNSFQIFGGAESPKIEADFIGVLKWKPWRFNPKLMELDFSLRTVNNITFDGDTILAACFNSRNEIDAANCKKYLRGLQIQPPSPPQIPQ